MLRHPRKGRSAAASRRICRQHSGKRLSLPIDSDPLADTVFAQISAIANSLEGRRRLLYCNHRHMHEASRS